MMFNTFFVLNLAAFSRFKVVTFYHKSTQELQYKVNRSLDVKTLLFWYFLFNRVTKHFFLHSALGSFTNKLRFSENNFKNCPETELKMKLPKFKQIKY